MKKKTPSFFDGLLFGLAFAFVHLLDVDATKPGSTKRIAMRLLMVGLAIAGVITLVVVW